MKLESTALNDSSTSYWLKNSITESRARDPVDMLNDIEILSAIINERLNEMNLSITTNTNETL